MNRAAFIFLLLVGLICVALLLVNAKFGGGAEPLTPECVADEDRVHIRALALQAIDDGLKDQIKYLFQGWLKDPASQPHRAAAGINNAIVAYQRGRADVLKWSPKSC